jgi:hypothetical protein
MPAWPKTVTSCGARSRSARWSALSSSRSSCSRPIIGVASVARSARAARSGASASHTSVGAERPRSVTAGRAANLIAARVSAYVVPHTSTPPGGATACMREAVLTTSPATIACPPSRAAATSTSASPVATPTRKRRSPANPVSTRCSSSPARTHRSASLSVATGAPKRAITASPMYFSTTPPYCPTTRRAAEKKPVCMPRTSSGSLLSTYGVKSIRSTNSTLIRRRSSCGAVAWTAATAAPHAVQ